MKLITVGILYLRPTLSTTFQRDTHPSTLYLILFRLTCLLSVYFILRTDKYVDNHTADDDDDK